MCPYQSGQFSRRFFLSGGAVLAPLCPQSLARTHRALPRWGRACLLPWLATCRVLAVVCGGSGRVQTQAWRPLAF